MWGSASRAAKYIRSTTTTKSILANLKEHNAVRHPPRTQQPTTLPTQSSVLFFSPRSITEIPYRNNAPSISEFPVSRIPLINPRSILPLVEDAVPSQDMSLPPISDHEVHAVRLIVIRRKKMKKHKLRKLRKKMRSRWHQVKQRRRIRKEKAFRAQLLAMVKKSEAFSAEEYVERKLALVNHTPLHRMWKGKRLPVFIIRQLLGLDPKINYKHTDVYKA